MQKISFIVLLLGLLFSQEINAQNNLSLKEAVTIAIQNSYDIKLVENSLSIAQNNNNYGVAGGLPTVTANGTNNNTLTTINQTFPDPSRIILDPPATVMNVAAPVIARLPLPWVMFPVVAVALSAPRTVDAAKFNPASFTTVAVPPL